MDELNKIFTNLDDVIVNRQEDAIVNKQEDVIVNKQEHVVVNEREDLLYIVKRPGMYDFQMIAYDDKIKQISKRLSNVLTSIKDMKNKLYDIFCVSLTSKYFL